MKNWIIIALLSGLLITHGIIAFCLWENKGINRYSFSMNDFMVDTKNGIAVRPAEALEVVKYKSGDEIKYVKLFVFPGTLR